MKIIACSFILLFTILSPASYAKTALPAATQQVAVISTEDAKLLKAITVILENSPGSALHVIYDKGNINVSGVAQNSRIASTIIGNITYIAKKRPINFEKIALVDGTTITKETLATGQVQGLLLASGLYGTKVTTIEQMPVEVSASNNIIFLDGGVDSLHILSQTIIIAQRLAITFTPPMRVISRMYIKGLVYGT